MAITCWASTSRQLVGALQRLDAPGRHLARQHRLVQQIGQRLRDQPALARLADEMPGAADALQTARDIAGRFDLADEIDGAHVDAEFQRRRGDDGAQPAFLERLLRLPAHFQRDAAVMGAHERLRSGGLAPRRRRLVPEVFIQIRRHPLDAAAIVGEDDRRAMPAYLLGKTPIDGGPDRFFRQRPELLDGADDLQIEVLAQAGIDDCDRARPPVPGLVIRITTEIACDLLERPLRGRQADADEGPLVQLLASVRARGRETRRACWGTRRESHRRCNG